MFDKDFDNNFTLTSCNKCAFWINLLYLIYMSSYFLYSCKKLNFHSYIIGLLSLVVLMINIYGSFCYKRCSGKHSYYNQNVCLLYYSYLMMSVGSFMAFITTILFPNPVTLILALIGISMSISSFYYVIRPIYLNDKLSIRNFFNASNRMVSSNIIKKLLVSAVLIILALSLLLITCIPRAISMRHIQLHSHPNFEYVIDGRTKYISSKDNKSLLMKRDPTIKKFKDKSYHNIRMVSIEYLKHLDKTQVFLNIHKSHPYFQWIKVNNTMYIYSKYSNKTITKDSVVKQFLNHYYSPKHSLKRVNKSSLKNINDKVSNSRYLKNFQPRYSHICYVTMMYTFSALIEIMVMIVMVSLIYSWKNRIRIYKELHFIMLLFLIILRFISITIPVIYFISNNVINYFIVRPSSLNMQYASGILLFLPFIEILYGLTTVNSMLNVEC